MKILKCTDDNENGNNKEKVESVKQFTYLGAIFTNIYDITPEIKRQIAMDKAIS